MSEGSLAFNPEFDPDGYWIEILNADAITSLIGEQGALSH